MTGVQTCALPICHASGCGKWFNALRDTVSYRIAATWKIGEPAPEAAAAHLNTPRSAA